MGTRNIAIQVWPTREGPGGPNLCFVTAHSGAWGRRADPGEDALWPGAQGLPSLPRAWDGIPGCRPVRTSGDGSEIKKSEHSDKLGGSHRVGQVGLGALC